jgi:hypothetical protein
MAPLLDHALAHALHGDHTQVRRAVAERFRLLVDLRLIPALRGRKVFKLEHHQAGRLPVALKDDEFAAADEEPAAARRDRSRRCGLVLLITLMAGLYACDLERTSLPAAYR